MTPLKDLMTHELIAIVCYEANRAYCNVNGGFVKAGME